MFGLFKKKPPTVMDALIRTIYGANPPPKSADLERSITIAHEDLLGERVPLSEVKTKASALFKGPIPYSTHDLAVSTALAFFKSPEYVSTLQECQIPARLRVVNWAEDGKVAKLLQQSFEEVLYRVYKPQPSEAGERPMKNEEADRKIQESPPPKPTAMEPEQQHLPKGPTDGLGWGPPQMADYYSVIARAISALPSKTGVENRRGVYERARTALRETLRTRNPPLSETELTKELCALEAAIRRVEKDTAFSDEQLSDLKRLYPEQKVCFKAKAIRELYGGKQPTPDDGILGWVPDIKEQLASADDPDNEIELSLVDWNTHAIPDDVVAKLHDSMRIKSKETNRFGLEPIRKSEQKRPFYLNRTLEERREWFADTPPWNRLAPAVINAILDAITDKALLDVFVASSMNQNLLPQYEQIDTSKNSTVIRLQISNILCQAGRPVIASLTEAVKEKQT